MIMGGSILFGLLFTANCFYYASIYYYVGAASFYGFQAAIGFQMVILAKPVVRTYSHFKIDPKLPVLKRASEARKSQEVVDKLLVGKIITLICTELLWLDYF
mmetsp:Transcript_35881/g.55081  ORF Transcript_35881/g.55081 Transcript_35881/m.55081 type:complete len:102 (+) Transcript_35881:212-517(+)